MTTPQTRCVFRALCTEESSVFPSTLKECLMHVLQNPVWKSLVSIGVAGSLLFAPNGSAQVTPAPAVYNVRDYGARPNDNKSDHEAIQAAINAAKQTTNAMVYFPAGTYLAGDVQITDSTLGLTLSGDGSTASILKRIPSSARQATVTNSTDIVIKELGWNAIGIEKYGGVAFYDTKRVTIHHTRAFDSHSRRVGDYDRFAYVFSRGTRVHETIRIYDNLIQDLQLEVDYARDVRIERNTIERPVATAGIGTFSLNDGGVAEDFYIVDNTIIDPTVSGGAIAVHLDPPTTTNTTFRNIHIENNTIVYKSRTPRNLAVAIRMGTPNNSVSTTGNTFDRIWVMNNTIQIKCGVKKDFEDAVIWAANSRSGGVADFPFNNLTITDNQVHYRHSRPLVRVDKAGENYVEARNLQAPCMP
jgi:polygalacturonase